MDVWQELEKRLRTDEDRHKLSRVSIILASLRGFLTISEGKRGRTAREILDELTTQRAAVSTVPDILTEELRRYLDRQEQELYELLLPHDLRQQAADSINCDGQSWQTIMRQCIEERGANAEAQAKATVTPEGQAAFMQAYLMQLRAQLLRSTRASSGHNNL